MPVQAILWFVNQKLMFILLCIRDVCDYAEGGFVFLLMQYPFEDPPLIMIVYMNAYEKVMQQISCEIYGKLTHHVCFAEC